MNNVPYKAKIQEPSYFNFVILTITAIIYINYLVISKSSALNRIISHEQESIVMRSRGRHCDCDSENNKTNITSNIKCVQRAMKK